MLWYLILGFIVLGLLRMLWLRLQLSLAKHRSLTGHARMARRLARLIPFYEYDERQFFRADGAPDDIAARRRQSFMQLAALYAERFPRSAALTRQIESSVSDLQFTARYRVPFQFSRLVREHLRAGSFLESSANATVTDLDGNQLYDLTGSYGANLFGYDFYKECIARGSERVHELGPVLGAYHPVLAYNVQRLREISGLDEISMHMSGTEAVMQAVRLARYHTRRRHLVRFCGAYHGWWGDVQPGVGNPLPAENTYTLKDMDEASLRVLRSRRDIACVLVNPLQALHPNAGAPADSGLIDSARNAGFDRAAYTLWLRKLRRVCTERNIVLIYGKTLGGGLPVGVVCGRRALMQRFTEQRPADVCFARGTFNSHPYVMGAMYEFLQRLQGEPVRALYRGLDELWERRAATLNESLRGAGLPVQVSHLSSIWTVTYLVPSRYNWMLQYYLRAQGLALSWVGTGRLIFSLNYTDADFAAVTERFVAAAQSMQRDGWWWQDAHLSNKSIKQRVLRELVQARWATSRIGSRSSPRSRYSGARQ